jgi:TonB family protein
MFSLLVHALILSLQLGIPGIGLPSFELPWRERRAQAIRLDVVLADVGRTAPPESAAAQTPAAEGGYGTPLPAATALKLYSSPDALRPARPAPAAARKARARKSAAQAIARRQPVRPKKETPVVALDEARKGGFAVAPPAIDEAMPEKAEEYEAPTPVLATTEPDIIDNQREPAGEDKFALESELAALKRAEEKQARLARETETRRQQDALAQRQAQEREARRREEEAARQAEALALEQAARQQEEMRKREQRLALEREERRKEEENRYRQAALALQKQEEARQKREQEEATQRALELAARQREEQREKMRHREAEQAERDAAELKARKQAEELAAKEKERAQELAARQKAEAEAAAASRREPELAAGHAPGADRPAGLAPLPRNITGGGLAAYALEQARRPDLLRSEAPPARQPEAADNARRRGSILGGADKDVGVMMYVDSWRLKIERNGSLNYRQSSVEKARGEPIVTVSIRSDGSVEDIVIHRSSGRPELDEAVRRIVRLNARYSAFPPELARRFDVIEIRRLWNFDDGLRILEELP